MRIRLLLPAGLKLKTVVYFNPLKHHSRCTGRTLKLHMSQASVHLSVIQITTSASFVKVGIQTVAHLNSCNEIGSPHILWSLVAVYIATTATLQCE